MNFSAAYSWTEALTQLKFHIQIKANAERNDIAKTIKILKSKLKSKGRQKEKVLDLFSEEEKDKYQFFIFIFYFLCKFAKLIPNAKTWLQP